MFNHMVSVRTFFQKGRIAVIGLLMKDLLNMKRMAKQYLLILAAMCVWSVFMKNPFFITMYTVLCTSMLVLSSFSYDEQGQFDKYALTMPVTRRTLVRAKYALYLLMELGGIVLGILVGYGMERIIKAGTEGFMETGLIMGGMFLMVYGIVIPIIYKMGVEKARLLTVGIYLATFGLIYGMVWLRKRGAFSIEMTGMSEEQMVRIACVGFFFVALLTAVVSYLVSLRIVEKKEF